MSFSGLRRYKLPSIKGEGWAIIVIGSDGYFSTVSDWGNYAFLWGSTGRDDFRSFLTELNPDYFHSKIARDTEVWDEEQTEKNIRARLDELVEAGKLDAVEADNAFDEASGNVGSWEAIALWLAQSYVVGPIFGDIAEGIVATKPEPDAWGFATKVLPRFQEMLRAELESERIGLSNSPGHVAENKEK